MDEITLNGFEVFEDFLPGANVPKKETQPAGNDENKDILDSVGESMTDEELEALRNPKKEEDTKDDKQEEEVKEPVKEPKKESKKEDKKSESEEEIEEEVVEEPTNEPDSNAVSAFFGVMAEKFGWEMGDDDEVPSTPEELVDYFQAVIEENSVPQYASEEVEALDNFVKNGGNLRDYFEIDGELDLEDFSIEDNEVNQKIILKEFLKEKGYSNKQIDKKLTKYEDAGLLEDEAEDALEALKEIRENKKQQLLKDQENQAREAAKRQQEYFNSVVNEIKGMQDIRGIKIPEKDKKQLLEYIFKPDADGKTQYQKDWSKSVKNLLESAYFTMKGDTLLKAAKNEGSSDAISKFKNSLNKTGVSRRTKKTDNTSDIDMWKSFAQQLRVN
ncbi:regulatory protein [uncultured phage cr52_1]|jgi:hypothetical protein|uniref:Regulatory protein n=1 Tax=uncultured phage cr52_1 TaxID=2772079 RepID=A0A7M1RS22_9CAUD|nr:regulatory protein [uncultured phage cr52_1]QOR56711.1 regulatory protein [uncultured phage cr52_1]